MTRPHVLLYEPDQDTAGVLVELFSQEEIVVTPCDSSDSLDQALVRDPYAIVVTNTWDPSSPRDLSTAEREGIAGLASKTWVIVTSTRPYADQLQSLAGSERIIFVSKPYDLNDMLAAVRRASAGHRSAIR